MREYLRSPYVIIGVIGIVYYLYKRNILVNKINKEIIPAISSNNQAQNVLKIMMCLLNLKKMYKKCLLVK